MRIAVLTPTYEGSDSVFKGLDPQCDPAPYAPEHHFERHVIEKATSGRQVRELARQGYDVFFNLCDGAWDEDRPGIDVVQALERMGVAFTGATSPFYEPTREVMKRVCHYAHVRTPAFAFATSVADAERVRGSCSRRRPTSW